MISLRSSAVSLLCAVLPLSQVAAQVSANYTLPPPARQYTIPSQQPAPEQAQYTGTATPQTAATPAYTTGQWLAYAGQLAASRSAADQARAFSLYSQMAHDGNATAAQHAAWMSLNGVGVTRDPKYAAALLQWLVRGGDSWSMTQLGGCYRRGDGVPWDEGYAMKLFQAAAQRTNDAEAESELGRGYLNGFGPDTTNYPQAVRWFSMASRQGYQPAQLQLGYMYQRGWGVELNRGTAASLYRAAANSRDPHVQKTANDLQQSLQRDQSDSDGTAVLAVLGVLAVAAIASSSSSSSSASTPTPTPTNSGSNSYTFNYYPDAAAQQAERDRLNRQQESDRQDEADRQRRQQQEQDRRNMDEHCGVGRYC